MDINKIWDNLQSYGNDLRIKRTACEAAGINPYFAEVPYAFNTFSPSEKERLTSFFESDEGKELLQAQ